MKKQIVLTSLLLLLLPSHLMAEPFGPPPPPQPEEHISPEEAREMVELECMSEEHEECTEFHFHCALDVLHQLEREGFLCHIDFLHLKHEVELKLVHLHGFREGFQAGFEEAEHGCHQPQPHPSPAPGEPGETEEPEEKESGKVAICHVPKGNPDNAHTIHVGEAAVEAHLQHGDSLGLCEGDGENGSGGGDDEEEHAKKKKKKKKKSRKKKRKGRKKQERRS